MTKKRGKKTTKTKAKKTPVPSGEKQGSLGRQILAVLLIVAAIALIITWFSSDNTILSSIHKGATSFIGYSTYLVPVFLVFFAIKIFKSEDNRLPISILISSIIMLIWFSGLTGIPTIGQENPTGGMVGEWLNGLISPIINPAIAIFVYIALMFVTALFVFQTKPSAVFNKIGEMFGKTEKDKNENLSTQSNEDSGLKINFNEPTVGHSTAKFKKRGLMKVTKPSPRPPVAVEPKALVAANDPNWQMPPVTLLEKKHSPPDSGNAKQNAYIIESTFAEFGIDVQMQDANVGPRVTQYTMKPPSGVSLSKIVSHDKELALNLAVDKIRIEAPIPGTRSVGVEIPNVRSADVRLRGILESEEWQTTTDPLSFAVGQDISGKPVVANLAKMPHLLVAGTTGSGKSVMTNTLITSLLFRNSPSDMKLIIVDPKQVEMAQYEDIPHLLTPIITSTEKSLSALKWTVNEMERRYSIMAKERVKKIDDYNAKMTSQSPSKDSTESDNEKMPYIVVIIDEMADLMMMAGKDLEMLIVRIAQKGRAAGIHLVLATQRPEVKVITGLIKANVPGRIAFAVGSQVDSRIMLDKGGAEKLLGKGDMLMLTTEMMGKPRRIQGAFSSDSDIAKVTDFLRAQRAPEYNDEVVAQPVQIKGLGSSSGGIGGGLGRKFDPNDELVRAAVEICIQNNKFATSLLQTHLSKSHGWVSGLAVWLEQVGVIGPPNGHKPREILVNSMEEFDELVNAGEP